MCDEVFFTLPFCSTSQILSMDFTASSLSWRWAPRPLLYPFWVSRGLFSYINLCVGCGAGLGVDLILTTGEDPNPDSDLL